MQWNIKLKVVGVTQRGKLGAEMAIARLLLLLSLQTAAALDVSAPPSHSALLTNSTVLTCTFSLDGAVPKVTFFGVFWRFHEKVILKYKNQTLSSSDPRMSLRVPALQAGDASLHISDVRISDGGIYTCVVIYTPEHREKDILLNVQAKPLLSVSNKKVRVNIKDSLTCTVSGFFPSDIGITWLKDGEELKDSFMENPQQDKDGTYQVTSTLPITATTEEQNRTYSCRVQHASLPRPLQRDLQLDLHYGEESYTAAVVFCAILAVSCVIVIIVTSVVWWKRKKRTEATKLLTVQDIEGPAKLVAGEEAILRCTATGQEVISVTWLEKKGREILEICPTSVRDVEEEETLLNTAYKIGSKKEDGKYSSSLKFRPSLARHKDMTLICRFQCGQCTKEKTFRCGPLYAKPKQTQPVSRSLLTSRELKYSVRLESFYPRKITITWTCGEGKSQAAVPSKEEVAEIPDGTYSISSEVTIPENRLKNPEFKVRVSWEHEALNTPGYRDLSIRDADYVWNPVVEEIRVPRLFQDTPTTLQCNISEYFPGDVAVTWLRRKKETEELVEETGALVSRPDTQREAENTYSCTGSLPITPTLLLHQGAAYICRVQHPSLEKPIERKTGQLQVTGKPRMVPPIEVTMGQSSRVHFTLRLHKFYPKDITILWTCEHNNFRITPHNVFTFNDDLTYDVTSDASIPKYTFTDPKFKVCVTWSHQSLEEEESRSLALRDLPWPPKVGEIVIPNMEENKSAALSCEVSDYFPDVVTVSWFKKEDGGDSEPILTPLLKIPYSVSHKDNGKKKNELYSRRSSLTFSPSLSRDQGAEFICRVEHPSLEHPIERSTGPLQLTTHNQLHRDSLPHQKKML